MSADGVLESVFDLLHCAGTQLEKHHGGYRVVGIGISGMGRKGVLLSRPVQVDMRLIGRAMPVLVGDVFGPQTQPFGRLTQALDALGTR